MASRDSLAAANGRWPDILAALAGVTPDQLCLREGPCPACGGRTRFRWDDQNGDGTWHCSHCGGKDRQGGGGNGIDLLLRLRGWSFQEAAAAVDEHLGRPAGDRRGRRGSGGPRGRTQAVSDAPRPAAPRPTERVAFDLLEAAGELAEGELFAPTRQGYVSRWLRWSGDHPDEAASILLEHQTVAQVVGPPAAEPEPGPPRDAIDRVSAALGAALSDGASRADLERLCARLADEHELPASTIGRLLRAQQQELEAAAAIDEGRRRLEVAADRQEIGGQLIRLEQLFPPSIAGAIRVRTADLPSDDVCSAALYLSAAASVQKLGNEIIAKRSAGFRVPLNLYLALVSRSGAKKGPLQRLIFGDQLKPIVEELTKDHARAMAHWREENANRKPTERSEKPIQLRILCSEWTGESLDATLADLELAGRGLAIVREEISGMFGGLNAYRGGRGADSEKLLESYDGQGSASLRVSAEGGGRFYSRCQLTIVGGIQPMVLERLVADGDPSGLWARFICAPVPERVVPVCPDETADGIRAAEDAAAVLAAAVDRLYRLPLQELELSDDARRQFLAYEARCQGDALRAPLPPQQALWGKAAGKALRLAGLLHLLHSVCPDGRRSERVEPWAIEQATNLADHLTGWTLGVHEASLAEGATDLMRSLHRLAESQGQPIGWRDMSRRLSRRQRGEVDSAACQAAAAALADLGFGRLARNARGGWAYTALKALPG